MASTEYPKDCGADEDMKMTNSTRQLTFEVCQTYPRIKLEGNHAVINRSSSKHLYFGETADTGSYYFRGTGKMGIGTTSPNQKLEVDGAITVGNKSGTPADGTIWFDGSVLKVQLSGSARTIHVT